MLFGCFLGQASPTKGFERGRSAKDSPHACCKVFLQVVVAFHQGRKHCMRSRGSKQGAGEGAPILFVRQAGENCFCRQRGKIFCKDRHSRKGRPRERQGCKQDCAKAGHQASSAQSIWQSLSLLRNAAKKSFPTETNEQIHQRWHNLSPEELQNWKMRQRLQSGRKKVDEGRAGKRKPEDKEQKIGQHPMGSGG